MPTQNIRQINGVVRTSEPTWSNLERLAEAASVWFTYDTHAGVYAWVINQAGNSVASITEADIIGPIQISGSGLNNLYNAVEVEYPRNDMNDQPHYVTLNLPDDLRNAYEPDNTLQMSSEFINNQPQAEYVGMVTLKQSRLDRTVTIVMDYTKISLQAGDIIDISSNTYGWTDKEFRIMRVREIEGDDGSLRLEFSCTEYDDTIYSGTWDNFLVAGAPGIRSMGTIGTPGTPTISVANINSLPTQVVSTTVPAGIVDRVQFWAGNVAITSNVSNTSFNLVSTIASTDANSFTAGNTVVLNDVSLNSGTWAWKTRGVNGQGTGPFSSVSANVAWQRGQISDYTRTGSRYVDDSGTIISAIPNKSLQNGFFNLPFDFLTFTGNGAYKGMIFTGDTFMSSIGNTKVANALSSVCAPATGNACATFTLNTTVQSDTRAALGIEAGVAVYYATAPWNQSTYNTSGFAGLTWSDWRLIGLSLDDSNSLNGNVRMTVSGDPAFNFANMTGNVVAFGFSSTLMPTAWNQLTPGVLPGSDIPGINYTKGFSGNTVIYDATGNVGVKQTPGLSVANTTSSGQTDSWMNWHFRT